MKSTTLLSLATFLSIGICLPTTRQELAWSFSVYQSSERCTGARDPYSGTGSQGCTQGIRNGSFGSFIRGDIREDCSVYLYNNGDCDPAGLIDILTAGDPQTCQQPQLELSGSASFEAVCG